MHERMRAVEVISFETDGPIFVGEGSINELKDGYYAGNKGNPKKTDF